MPREESVNTVACGGPTLPTSVTFLSVLPQLAAVPGSVHMSYYGPLTLSLSPPHQQREVRAGRPCQRGQEEISQEEKTLDQPRQ